MSNICRPFVLPRGWAVRLIVTALWLGTWVTPAIADAVCGNGVIEPGEDCDDGGICVGGANAGTRCTNEAQCIGNGACVGGAHAGTTCDSDLACPGSRCVHCTVFGGDGCGANCTAEIDIQFVLDPGVVGSTDLLVGTSGTTLHGDILTLPKPLSGVQTLTLGKPGADGTIPVVIKADAMQFGASYSGPGAGCACVRGVARSTCGGTLFETDGVTPSPDCTLGYTAGESVCEAAHPCTPLHGVGNAAAGVLNCNGATGSGSAALLATTATGLVVGLCTGTDPVYGSDHMFCTADDPQSVRGTPSTAPLSTGTASVQILNANGIDGNNLGPFSVTGNPFQCNVPASESTAGACLVSAFTETSVTLGDTAVTFVLCAAMPTGPTTATPTPTPSATPVATLPAQVCSGDCNGNRQVTIDEIVTGINIVLGNTPLSICPNFQCCPDGCASEGVDCAIRAINNALFGCEPPPCGNGITEPNEECDDGGTCIGGMNAGTHCSADSQCTGNGICTGGVHAGMSCAADAQCGNGHCVHCKTFGGDGCAANCTREADIPFPLVPGSIAGNDIVPGTSGSVIHGDVLVLPLPLTGGFTLTVGKDRGDGQLPVVMRAGSFHPPPIHPSTLGTCVCVRDVAAKTCGGTFLELDGSQSPDCTFGASPCTGRNPCTFMHGAGNAGDGVVDCHGHVLEGIDVVSTAQADRPSGATLVARSGTGETGSAALLQSLTLAAGIDFCGIADSAQFGPDGHFCTDDDPPSARGTVTTAPFVTGSATAQIFNANGTDGDDIGPFSVSGSPFQCSALRSGSSAACLASAHSTRNVATLGDYVETMTFCATP